MIRDTFFVLRMLGISVIVMLAMQTKIGQKTIEQNFEYWVQNSILVDKMQVAIDGGFALAQSGFKKATEGLNFMVSKITRRQTEKQGRQSIFGLKRHGVSDDEAETNSGSGIKGSLRSIRSRVSHSRTSSGDSVRAGSELQDDADDESALSKSAAAVKAFLPKSSSEELEGDLE